MLLTSLEDSGLSTMLCALEVCIMWGWGKETSDPRRLGPGFFCGFEKFEDLDSRPCYVGWKCASCEVGERRPPIRGL